MIENAVTVVGKGRRNNAWFSGWKRQSVLSNMEIHVFCERDAVIVHLVPSERAQTRVKADSQRELERAGEEGETGVRDKCLKKMDSREVGHKLRQVLHLYGCFSVGDLLDLICVQLIVVVVLVVPFIAPVVWLTHVGIMA